MWPFKKRKHVGKDIGGMRYIHKLYIHTLEEKDLVKLKEALDIINSTYPEWDNRWDEWNVLKFSLGERFDPPVSLCVYKDFDKDPHPELATTYVVHSLPLNGKLVHMRGGGGSILHRKELLVGEDYPRVDAWAYLTRQEEAVGLYDKEHIHRIGRLTYWEALLETKGVHHRGHLLYHADGALVEV